MVNTFTFSFRKHTLTRATWQFGSGPRLDSFCLSWSQSRPGVGKRGIINKRAMTIMHQVIGVSPVQALTYLLLLQARPRCNERISVTSIYGYWETSANVWSAPGVTCPLSHVPCPPRVPIITWQCSSVWPETRYTALILLYKDLYESSRSMYYKCPFCRTLE